MKKLNLLLLFLTAFVFAGAAQAQLEVKDGAGTTRYMGASGAGSSSDPYISENIDASRLSTVNSSTTAINTGSNFTGTWEQVGQYDSVVVSVATDQNGYYEIQFSPDGTNVDSTLTRYYRTSQINVPHRFTITRDYMRLRFFNNSGTNQTYFRLQTLLGGKSDLNIPVDAVMSQDYDALSVRPTDFKTEVALGRRQGFSTWNKFGYNLDIDAASGFEVVAAFGGTFDQLLTTARTLSIVSTDAADDGDPQGTGAGTLLITGVDENWDVQTETITLNGTSAVTTSNTWLGVNRIETTASGSNNANVGTITATATTDGNVMASIPAGASVTEQMIFYVPNNHQFLISGGFLSVDRSSGGGSASTFYKGWVYSDVTETQFDIFDDELVLSTGSRNNRISLFGDIEEPFPVGEKSIIWFEVDTTADDTSVRGRFSGKLVRDVDG